MARATSSLPVPLSPWTRTVERCEATSRASSNTAAIRAFLETRSWNRYCRVSLRRRIAFSRSRFFTRMIRSTRREISWGWHGLTMYSCAPSFIAVIAVSTVAYAVMTMTDASGWSRRSSIIVSMPSSPPGILRSTK